MWFSCGRGEKKVREGNQILYSFTLFDLESREYNWDVLVGDQRKRRCCDQGDNSMWAVDDIRGALETLLAECLGDLGGIVPYIRRYLIQAR